MRKIFRVTFHTVEPKMQSLWFYTFQPCSCGCTDTYGWGFNFPWFGFAVHTKEVKKAKK